MLLPPLVKKNVSFGGGGLLLHEPAEIPSLQIGYSILFDGLKVAGDRPGDWKESWIVIGNETCCGDPIFLDSISSDFPVYTARHGAGSWDAVLISQSYKSFLQDVDRLADLSHGRETPIGLEKNPMLPIEVVEFLSYAKVVGGVKDAGFWADMVAG